MGQQQKRALVSGGCGFVGRHFARRLLENDYRVTIVDDLSTGLDVDEWPQRLRPDKNLRKNMDLHIADFRDFAKVNSPDYDLIIHLAAVVGGRMTIEGDPLSVATDLSIDAIFFNWLAKNQARQAEILYFSSSAAYPIKYQTRSYHIPLSEQIINFERGIDLPDMTYGWSKLSGEFLAKFAVDKYSLKIYIYRPFSGYGEDQDLTYPFPSILSRVLNRESPIMIWGSGEQLRDFIHIDDVIEAVFASFPRMKPGDALNLGSGIGVSFRELAQLACRVTGHRSEIINDASKPEGVFARIADCARMFRYYKPRISLAQGIERAGEFLLSRHIQRR